MSCLDADVAVVGYGPVGAMTALLLARQGVRTVVVDRHREVYPLPRAVAADGEVLQVLAHAGLQPSVAAMRPALGARFAGPGGGPLLDVDLGSATGGPGLALYRQPELERDLRARVEAHQWVTVLLGAGVTRVDQDEQGVYLHLTDGRRLRSRYLVACDGARSPVRRQLGIPLLGSDEGRSWLVVDSTGTAPEWVHPHRVTYLCDPRRPAVAMRTPTGWRLESMLTRAVPDGPVDRSTARRLAGPRLAAGGDAAVERAAVYRFAARTAARWRVGRVLLAGDAAHTMPPFAGQGLAAGLRDAHNLAWKLALVVHGRASDRLLDSYHRERLPHLRRMVALTRVAGGLVTTPAALAPARDAALRLVSGLPALTSRVTTAATRPHPLLPPSAWPGLPGSRLRGGHLLPAHLVTSGAFSLLGHAGDPGPASALDTRAGLLWQAVDGQSATAAGELSDLVGPGHVLVLRPDAVVAGVVPAALLPGAVVNLLGPWAIPPVPDECHAASRDTAASRPEPRRAPAAAGR